MAESVDESEDRESSCPQARLRDKSESSPVGQTQSPDLGLRAAGRAGSTAWVFVYQARRALAAARRRAG